MQYKANPPDPRVILKNLKQSAQKRGIPFDLTPLDIMYMSFPITCPILGIPLHWNIGQMGDDSYSFDRIDNSIGYTVDNIQVLSLKANRAKNNLSLKELKLLAQFYSE